MMPGVKKKGSRMKDDRRYVWIFGWQLVREEKNSLWFLCEFAWVLRFPRFSMSTILKIFEKWLLLDEADDSTLKISWLFRISRAPRKLRKVFLAQIAIVDTVGIAFFSSYFWYLIKIDRGLRVPEKRNRNEMLDHSFDFRDDSFSWK